MLSESQCELLKKGLNEDVDPRRVAAYLCLHMGLMLAEAAALRMCDIDLDAGMLTLRNSMGRPDGAGANAPLEFMPMEARRELPIPAHVQRYLRKYSDLYGCPDCFIISGKTEIPPLHGIQNVLTSISIKYKITKNLSVTDLRNAFIRRCLEDGVDLYSLCAYIGIKQPQVIVRRFAEYLKADYGFIHKTEKYAGDYPWHRQTAERPVSGGRGMNLLILGAGSQGPVVKEIAEAIGIFDEIAFLDDDPNNSLAIASLSALPRLRKRFPMAAVSFGDSFLRKRYMNEIERLDYIVPSLIHPSVTLSSNAKIGKAVVIEARCVVSAGAVIGKGAILSSASVIEPNANVGQFVHIGASSTVSKGASVEDYRRIPSGTVVRTENEKQA